MSKRLLLLVLASSLVPCAFSQEITAGLQGTVKDPSGAVIAKAVVEVTSPSLIGLKRAETDQAGYYRFANLPPGTYTLTVTTTGFRTYKQGNIVLEVGHLPSLDVRMELGTATEVVEVSAATRADRPHAEQGADQHPASQPDESAHPEPLVPERHSVRSRGSLRTVAEQRQQRQQWIPDQRRQQLRELLPGGWPGNRIDLRRTLRKPTCRWTSSTKCR